MTVLHIIAIVLAGLAIALSVLSIRWHLQAISKRAEADVLASGEPAELARLPAEVRRLVHAADRMRDQWAEADRSAQLDLWRELHTASDAVWSRNDQSHDKPGRN